MDWFLGNQEKRKTILWVVIILVGTLLALMVFNSLFSDSGKNFGRLSAWADLAKYQAVFLTNGQVYFGKVTDANSQTWKRSGRTKRKNNRCFYLLVCYYNKYDINSL